MDLTLFALSMPQGRAFVTDGSIVREFPEELRGYISLYLTWSPPHTAIITNRNSSFHVQLRRFLHSNIPANEIWPQYYVRPPQPERRNQSDGAIQGRTTTRTIRERGANPVPPPEWRWNWDAASRPLGPTFTIDNISEIYRDIVQEGASTPGTHPTPATPTPSVDRLTIRDVREVYDPILDELRIEPF